MRRLTFIFRRQFLRTAVLACACMAPGDCASIAQAAWLPPHWDLTRLAFSDAVHTSAAGQQEGAATAINAAGQVIGYSARYDGASADPIGYSAWTAASDRSGLTRLGYDDGPHTAPDRGQVSFAVALNAVDNVLGYSERYDTLPEVVGRSAWLWSGDNGYTPLGLLDEPYTLENGAQFSQPTAVNAASQAIGQSYRANADGAQFAGASAWVYDSGVTTRLGFADAAHTSAEGVQNSYPVGISATGQVIGQSTTYSPSFGEGLDGWSWTTAEGLVRLGFVDAEHTRADGLQSTVVTAITDAGQAVGRSTRFNGNTPSGASAWSWTAGAGHVRLGYIDPAHTSSTGVQDSNVSAVNAQGRVIGGSRRYSGAGGPFEQQGSSAWTWTAEDGLARLGFTDPVHTAPDGTQTSNAVAINAAGQIIGTSVRYAVDWTPGSPETTKSGWFYDPTTQAATPLVFSVSTSGESRTEPLLITDGGWVVGSYDEYSGNTLVGVRAFIWSLADGFADLGSLVAGGLASQGWTELAPLAANEGSIVGVGSLANAAGSFSGFVLSRADSADFDADFDADGDVDGQDLLAWQQGFGQATGAPRGSGDADGDGDVDADDLATWMSQFGTAPATAGALRIVPEPLAVHLLALAAIGALLKGPAGRRRWYRPGEHRH